MQGIRRQGRPQDLMLLLVAGFETTTG